MNQRCQALTKGGTRCTTKAQEMGCCYRKSHKEQLGLIPVPTLEPSPTLKRRKVRNVIKNKTLLINWGVISILINEAPNAEGAYEQETD